MYAFLLDNFNLFARLLDFLHFTYCNHYDFALY